GATVAAAIRFGVARGVFSNEAGLGSAAIAHAAAKTNDPVRQGLIAMLGTFIDTIIVCTMTGLVIITSGLWTSGETGTALTSAGFAESLTGGAEIVSLAIVVFAFTTILGWSYYGERAIQYLFGTKAIWPYRILWVAAIPVGATLDLGFVWLLSDTLNAMMALPYLIGLIILGPMVFRITKEYWDKKARDEKKIFE
ncbi:MAG: alanine:cation symporter family protein, partial [Rhodobiaceae bacterium]|nr:alanine:cation symporter family protein [Rhodobiaceae bacterium]